MNTDFTNTYNMPVLEQGKNPWFSSTICKLGLKMNNRVIELNDQNSKIVESHINANPNYSGNYCKKIYEYHCLKNNGDFPKYNKDAVTDLVRMIDFENSTNVWKFHKNHVEEMVKYIIDPKNDFWKRLDKGDLDKSDIDLVDDLKEASGATTEGPKSLASKICKYFSEIFYGKDGYYINDQVIRHVLPYYISYYGIKCLLPKLTKTAFENISYSDLFNQLEDLRDFVNGNLNCSLNRSQLDHIMWYCYRYGK